MESNQEMVSKDKRLGRGSTRAESERVLRPSVDVFEDESGITLIADMPGVSRDGLDIEVEGDTLSIAGEVKLPAPEGMDALYAEVNSIRYLRTFTMSDDLARDGVDATLKDGVLRLHIPKREEVRPRKIEVQVD